MPAVRVSQLVCDTLFSEFLPVRSWASPLRTQSLRFLSETGARGVTVRIPSTRQVSSPWWLQWKKRNGIETQVSAGWGAPATRSQGGGFLITVG